MDKLMRILHIDLKNQQGHVLRWQHSASTFGGSNLARKLYERFTPKDQPWLAESQPIIFAIGPIMGLFPAICKVVYAFGDAVGQYRESYAGGNAGLALRFAGFDALIITGRLERLGAIYLSSGGFEVRDAAIICGIDPKTSATYLNKIERAGAGHRSVLSIGLAGERCSPLASINVDTHRHFGKGGGGALFGSKNIKALVIHGDDSPDIPKKEDEYLALYEHLFADTKTGEGIKDGQKTGLSGIKPKHNLHGGACASCPVGCVHPGFIRKKLEENSVFDLNQDEPIFWLGRVLKIKKNKDMLRLLELCERYCLDLLATAVALYWATMVYQKGVIDKDQTLYHLEFGTVYGYQQGITALASGANDFYKLLSLGAEHAAAQYGGGDDACPMGDEIPFLAGLLYTGLEEKDSWTDEEISSYVFKMIQQIREKELFNKLGACLFLQDSYDIESLKKCLQIAGFDDMSQDLDSWKYSQIYQEWKEGASLKPKFSKSFYVKKLPLVRDKEKLILALTQEYQRQINLLFNNL